VTNGDIVDHPEKECQMSIKYKFIIPWVVIIGAFSFFIITAMLVIFIPESLVTRISSAFTVLGILLTVILSGKGKLSIALGEKRIEKLAAKVYSSEDTEIFSVIERFRAPELYIKTFLGSRAKAIEIIGSAIPRDISFLGAVFRLAIARRLNKPKMDIYHIDHAHICVKFTISQKHDDPQHIVLWGPVGRKSKYGIDLCDFNPKAFDIFKREFDRLLRKAEEMDKFIQRTIVDCYHEVPSDIKSISEFVKRGLVPQEVADDFQKEFGKDVWQDVVEYIEKTIRVQTKDHGAKLGITERSILPAGLNETQVKRLMKFLQERHHAGRLQRPFSIILDLTYFCNLDCEGCGVPVKFMPDCSQIISWELTFDDVAAVMRGVVDFASKINLGKDLRFCIGGGEPTLHPDFDRIISYAAELFGSQNVSFDTNGTTLDGERLHRLAEYVGNIGIGLDGDAEYHDRWRNPHRKASVKSVFQKVIELLNDVQKDESIMNKLEIVFTPTTKNCDKLKDVAEIAKSYGVKRLSCHRFMLTGRARNRTDLEPSPEQYLKLFADIVNMREEFGLAVHFHHSFEELLCKKLGLEFDIIGMIAPCKVRRASLCISSDLKMHFCPWFVAYPFNHLGISLEPFLKSDNNNKKFYDISSIVDSLRKYASEKCMCPIANANIRWDRYADQPTSEHILAKCLLSEDDCERQVRRLFQNAIGQVR
jgi:MoaA/NifB/PqqE/SkfB family radical SAM enzyme